MHDGVTSATGNCPFVDATVAAVVARTGALGNASVDSGTYDAHVDRSASGASAHPAALQHRNKVPQVHSSSVNACACFVDSSG